MISTNQELQELIDDTVEIPAIPAVLTEVTEILDSPDGSPNDVAAAIEKDTSVTMRALRLINSPFYELATPIATMATACSMFGARVIKNLVVQATVLPSFECEAQIEGFDPGALWDHSFKAAMACRLLAQYSQVADGLPKEDAYTCGLIHDVGKLILLESQPDAFEEALHLSTAEGITLAAAEEKVFGFHHAHVGGLVASRWQLAPAVQAAVACHHSPASNAREWARGFIVKAANTFAHLAADDGQCGYHGDLLATELLQSLGLTAEQHADIMAQTRAAGMV